MASNRTNYDDALKEVYKPDAIQSQLCDACDLYKIFKVNTDDVSGRKVVWPLHLSRDNGITWRTETQDEPTDGNEGFTSATCSPMFLATKLGVTVEVIESSKDKSGAFAKAFEFQLQRHMKNVCVELDKAFYHRSRGELAVVASTATGLSATVDWAGATAAVLDQPGTRLIEVGGIYATGTPAEHASTGTVLFKVSSITDGDTFAVTGSTAFADNDLITRVSNSVNSYNDRVNGLNDIVSTGTLHNVSSTTWSVWKGYSLGSSTTGRDLDFRDVHRVIDEIELEGCDKPNLMLCSHAIRREILDREEANIRFDQGKQPAKGVDIAASDPKFDGIPIKSHRNIFSVSSIYFINTNDIEILQWAPLTIDQRNGAMLDRGTTFNYTARAYWYGNVRVLRRNSHGVLRGLNASY